MKSTIERIKYFESKYGSPSGDQCYGLGNALKNYLNIPKCFPLYVEMDHGIYQKTPIQSQLKTEYPILVTRSQQKNELDLFSKKAYVMGSPFIHYRRMNNIFPMEDAKGTVFFPDHSTHLIDLLLDWEEFASQLLILPQKYFPITVCMYWKDLLENRHLPFMSKGIEVACAGHSADPDFMRNFYSILRKFKFSSSNSISSAAFYSIEMGIPFFLYGNLPTFHNQGADLNVPQGHYRISQSKYAKYFLYNDLATDSVSIKREVEIIVGELLGLNENISKNKLRTVIFKSTIKVYMSRFFSMGERIYHKAYSIYDKINIFINDILNNAFINSKRLSRINQIPTHLTKAEKVAIHKIARRFQQKKKKVIIVEIGSFLGASSCFFASAINDCSKLYCIDTWGNHNMIYDASDTEEERDTYEDFKRNVLKYRGKIIELRKWSHEAFMDLKDNKINIDILFIDGDHNYESVKNDWDQYSSLLSQESLVVFHDTSWADGVKRVIKESIAEKYKRIKKLPNMEIYEI